MVALLAGLTFATSLLIREDRSCTRQTEPDVHQVEVPRCATKAHPTQALDTMEPPITPELGALAALRSTRCAGLGHGCEPVTADSAGV